MATVDITKDTLEETIANNAIVFAKVNTEDEQEIAASFQIRSIPTLMIFRDQIAIFSQAGMLPESGLVEVIGKTQELDMDQVRKEVAEQQAGKEESA
jgi:thioredoxin 1